MWRIWPFSEVHGAGSRRLEQIAIVKSPQRGCTNLGHVPAGQHPICTRTPHALRQACCQSFLDVGRQGLSNQKRLNLGSAPGHGREGNCQESFVDQPPDGRGSCAA